MNVRKTLVSMVASLFCACSSGQHLVNLEGFYLTPDHTINVSPVEPAMRGYLPIPHHSFSKLSYITIGQDGNFIEIKKLIKKSVSNEDSIKYVEDKLKEFEERKFDTEYQPLDLAFDVIGVFRRDISTNQGNGHYSLEYEVEGKKIDEETKELKVIYGREGQSIQTLDEFMSRKSALIGKYEGDCDDFSMALLTCYEIARKLSEENSGKSEFWNKLSDGLMRYQIVVFEERNDEGAHSLNASLVFSEDFTSATLFGIEPQCFSLDGSGNCPNVIVRKIIDKGNYLADYVIRNDNLIAEADVDVIYRFFNSQVSYRTLDLVLGEDVSPK